jgi:hypothetical protein
MSPAPRGVRLEVAIERATDRTNPRAHRLDADAVRHLSALFEQPDESEGFILHLVVRAATDR